jgi:DNA-directed RNA polymerase specialized sigma24 family protein
MQSTLPIQGLDGLQLSDQQWNDLSHRLFTRILPLIYALHIAAWYGEEKEIANDIVQTTLERAYVRAQQIAAGEAAPIDSLFSFCWTIAHHYCIDCGRREKRMIPLYTCKTQQQWNLEEQVSIDYDPVGDAFARLVQMSSLTAVVNLIPELPPKQRRALLINLAHLSAPYFGAEPTPLEIALARVGIVLRDYVAMYPIDAAQKNCYSSSLSLAYKRLRTLVRERYSSEETAA